jgi:hypothetical protein
MNAGDTSDELKMLMLKLKKKQLLGGLETAYAIVDKDPQYS